MTPEKKDKIIAGFYAETKDEMLPWITWCDKFLDFLDRNGWLRNEPEDES